MSNTLARKFRGDVTTDLTLSGGWVEVKGIDDLQPQIPAVTEDTSAYDTNGWGSMEITMYNWSAVLSFFRRAVSGVYDPGQEILRACQGQFGNGARVGFRWYDKNGGPEAYSGVAIVDWKRANTNVKNVEKAQVTLTGTDVPLNVGISNPGVAPAAPVITGASPAAVGTGGLLEILGVGFTGTTGASHVTIGGTNMASYIVVSDVLIVAVLPSGSAGSANIVVTNATGPSAAFAYTRGA
jgi:hypothetical protein